MSRNKDRVGGAHKTNVEAPPPSVMQDNSEGFSFVVPTEFVELPSEGRYYPEGHSLRGHDSIEIKQMTAKEEDLLTSRTLLKKGVALDRVIQNLIVDRSINATSLLVGDRNAIIVAIRKSGYGPEYSTKVTCPSCATAQEYLFDLNELEIKSSSDLSEANINNNEDGTFQLTLPATGAEISFRLLTGYDEKNFAKAAENDRKRKLEEKNVTRQLKNIVVSVNGDDSPQAIQYLVNNLPSLDSRHLRLAYELAAPNVDMTHHFECAECDYEQHLEVPLTADFFWPDR